MIKPIAAAFVVLGFGLTAACGDANEGREPTADRIDHPDAFPFAVAAISTSDLCPGTLSQSCRLASNPPPGATLVDITQHEPGRICMNGSVGNNGSAHLILSYSVYGADGITEVFDADALGITQVRFKLDPAATGITIGAILVKDTHCPDGFACRADGFALTDPKSKKILEFTQSGTVVVPLDDFVQQDRTSTVQDFDASKLDALYFGLNKAGSAGFCLSDFDFLDADGNVVTP